MLFRKFFVAILVVLVCGAFIAFNHAEILTKESNTKTLYTGQEDHSISLKDASQLTANFRAQASPDQPVSGYFGREAVANILAQEGCVGIRYYYGIDADGTPHIVLVGVNSEGNDMVEGLLAERASLCPPYCSEENELNSSTIQLSGNF